MTNSITPARVVVSTFFVIVLLVVLVGTVGAATPDEAPVAADTYLVTTGDTLWEIAAAHTLPGDDVRRTVYEIQRLNDMRGSVIVPGQVLQIP
jgi:LysM repeat protein